MDLHCTPTRHHFALDATTRVAGRTVSSVAPGSANKRATINAKSTGSAIRALV